MTEHDLDRLFSWHPPRPDQAEHYSAVRTAEAAVSMVLGQAFGGQAGRHNVDKITRGFAEMLLRHVPDCRERSLSLDAIRTVRNAANEWVSMRGSFAIPAQREQAMRQLYTHAAMRLCEARWWANSAIALHQPLTPAHAEAAEA
ncbi:MAG: hypothetical protein AAFV53_00280 [Myxococcota bacterium]